MTAAGRSGGDGGTRNGRPRVAYVMSRFPKLTETFVLYEILAVERHGVHVDVYPLLRERQAVVHPEAQAVVERARYLPFVSLPIVRSQLHFLRRRPRAYLGTLWAVARGTWRSANFFVGAIGIFAKVAHAARLMEADGVAHVHCHFATHPAVAGFIIRRLVGIPYSFTAHGSDLHVDRRMLREKVEEASFVVTISKFNRDLIVREAGAGAREKVRIIRYGIDPSVFRPNGTTEAPRPFTVVAVGTLHEVKGQAYLVEACRVLTERGLRVRCRLVGDGPDHAALARMIEQAGLGDVVELVGARPRDEVAAIVREADVLAAPSVPTKEGKREGMPNVLLEAMASGVAVVASRLAGIPELVIDGETGLLVPPRDAVALADALQRLHDDVALRRRLALAGRRKVLEEHDLATNAAELARHFAAGSAR